VIRKNLGNLAGLFLIVPGFAGLACNRAPPAHDGTTSAAPAAKAAAPGELTPLAAFTKRWTVAEGLGPGFNEAACSDCHDREGLGGSGDPAKPARVIASASLHLVGVWPRQAIAGRQPAALPADAVVNPRRGPPLFGLGLLEKISDQRLNELCDPADRDGDGVTGHVNINTAYDNRPGRFGLQAHTSNIRDFIGNALAGEIGISNPVNRDPRLRQDDDGVSDPESTANMVDLLTEYVRSLPAPLPMEAINSTEAQAGRKLFGDIGCATCHRPDPDPVAPGAYTDLCVHKLGAELAGGIVDFSAQADEWRTAPLWGLGRRQAFLHDGRTSSLVEAIRLHGGEAEASAKRFGGLAEGERQQLLAFLKAL
jgi:CxxC motif-containing protein (DUF1111 family)